MTVRLIRSDRLYTGVPYAYASIAPRGSLVFTAGACPLDDQGEVVGAGDVRAQAGLVMANLGLALAASGATLADVLKTTVFVASADRADLVAAWEVISAAFGDHDAPSTLLGVTVLGYTGQLVEIEAVAATAVLLPRCPGTHESEPGAPRTHETCDERGMLGTVARLRRYPVKSMLGEDVDAGDVTFSGLDRDRRLAVVSRRTGKVASAKDPRLWRDLLTFSAVVDVADGNELSASPEASLRARQAGRGVRAGEDRRQDPAGAGPERAGRHGLHAAGRPGDRRHPAARRERCFGPRRRLDDQPGSRCRPGGRVHRHAGGADGLGVLRRPGLPGGV